MLDGEIVAFDECGKPNFHRLGFGRAREASVAFVAFGRRAIRFGAEAPRSRPGWRGRRSRP
jgi:hypothetical protein